MGQAAQVPGKSKHSLSNGGKLVRSTGDNRRPVAGASHLAPKPQSNYKLSSSSQASKASVDSRRQLGSNNGNGPGRPVGSKGMPSKMPVNTMGSKSVTPGMRNPVNGVQKQPPSKVLSSVPKHSMDQRKDVRELHKPKMLPRPPPRPPVASSRAQVYSDTHMRAHVMDPINLIHWSLLLLFVQLLDRSVNHHLNKFLSVLIFMISAPRVNLGNDASMSLRMKRMLAK